MVTLSILKRMEDDNLGTIDTDLFFEEIPVDSEGNPKNGTWIVSRGSVVTRFSVHVQSFDLYVRYSNKLTGIKKAHELLEYLQESFEEICNLEAVEPYTTESYKNVRLVPTSGVESVGSDSQDKIVFVISGEVRYDKVI